MEDLEKTPEKEKCVVCEKETQVLKSTPIDLRTNYIEGAGQTCPECFIKIFGK